MIADLDERAAVFAALGEPTRLAIVEELAASDRSPKELIDQFGLATNLLAHHLSVLESAGLIERFPSSGDRRRRYIRLRLNRLAELALPTSPQRPLRPLFVCTHNAGRSQLAAALWRSRTGGDAESAGTEPQTVINPRTIAAAERAGLELESQRPKRLARSDLDNADIVVTVCDRAHEDLDARADWWHWSLPDPSEIGTDEAFDNTVRQLEERISALTGEPTP